MKRGEELKKEKISRPLRPAVGTSSPSLPAGLTSSGPATLTKDTWFLVISKCGHSTLLRASFTKENDEEESGLENVVQDFHWEQFAKSQWYKSVKRDYFGDEGEALWTAVAHCATNKLRDE